jgi:hypothetical protein
MSEIQNADIKANFIQNKKKAALKVSCEKAFSTDSNLIRNRVRSPVKLAWAVQSPKIAPRVPKQGSQPDPRKIAFAGASEALMTNIGIGDSAVSAVPSSHKPKEMLAASDLGNKPETGRKYSILTDRDIASPAEDPEIQMISDCSKGSRKFVTRKWQVLKVLDEHK